MVVEVVRKKSGRLEAALLMEFQVVYTIESGN